MGQAVSTTTLITAVAAGRVPLTTAVPSTTTTAAGRQPLTTAAGRVALTVATTSTSKPVAASTGLAGYTSLGCYQDFYPSGRTLNGYSLISSSMTLELCEITCNQQGFPIAGVENGDECYCGNAITLCATQVSSSSCSMTCAGNNKEICGGSNVLNVYAVSGYGISAQCTSTTTMKTSTTSKAATTTTSASTSQYTGVPGATGANKVFAHFMIGNTYSMTSVSQYETEIAKAISMGLDGFACNVGSDTWQPNRLSLMYQAALSYPSFVIFVSLDMSVLADEDFAYLYQFITPYTTHSAQYNIDGKQFVSTFSGETYTGGQSDPATAWLYFKNQLAAQGSNIYFLPSFTGFGVTCLGWAALDGAFSWNAWTKSTSEDVYYLQSRNNPSTYLNTEIQTSYNTGGTSIYSGKTYMAGIGPLLFTHFNYKNWVYSNDDLYTTRWDNIIAEQPDFVEIISWNDYGESHYIGDIAGSLPYDSNGVSSSSWAYSPQFDHTALGSLTQYYITAYKNKAYPAVTQNSLYMWYRPHSINAVATDDPYGEPTCESATCPVDNIYLTVLLTSSATVSVTSGSSVQTFNGVVGRNYFQFVGFSTGTPSVQVTQSGTQKLSESGTMAINNSITTYNYNLHYDFWTF